MHLTLRKIIDRIEMDTDVINDLKNKSLILRISLTNKLNDKNGYKQ